MFNLPKSELLCKTEKGRETNFKSFQHGCESNFQKSNAKALHFKDTESRRKTSIIAVIARL